MYPCYDHTAIVILGGIPFSNLARRGLDEDDQAGYIVGCLYRRSGARRAYELKRALRDVVMVLSFTCRDPCP